MRLELPAIQQLALQGREEALAHGIVVGIETIRMIVKGSAYNRTPGVRGKITFIENLFAPNA